MKPFRLLRITHSLNPAGGGVAEAIRQFGLASRANEIELTVATLDEPSDPWLNDLNLNVVALGPRKNGYGYTSKLIPWLESNASSFDAAIIDGLWQYHGWAAYRALRKQIPYYVMTHGMLDTWFKDQYPLKHLKKWLYWPWAEYRILRDAKGVIFTAEEEQRKARKSFWLYKTQKEVIAPLGIVSPSYDPVEGLTQFKRSVPNLGTAPYFLFMGRLHEKKGVDLLIRAYLRFIESTPESPMHLVLAGPAGDQEYLAKLNEETKDCPRIHFSGILRDDTKWAALAGAEALVLPSHQENFGIVVAEALSVETPVLISKRVDIWREIVAAKAGMAEEDSEDGALSLLNAFAETTLRKKSNLRISARECFEQNFELDASVQRLIASITMQDDLEL